MNRRSRPHTEIARVTMALNDRAAELAAAYDLPGGAGSDAHDAPGVGAAYVEMPDFDGPMRSAAPLGDTNNGHCRGRLRRGADGRAPRQPPRLSYP